MTAPACRVARPEKVALMLDWAAGKAEIPIWRAPRPFVPRTRRGSLSQQ